MTAPPQIFQVHPEAAVPGGEIAIACRGFEPGLPSQARVLFGNVVGGLVSASTERVIARVPDTPEALGLALWMRGTASPLHPFSVARRIASGLHPVTSPAVAPDGSVITTVSGSRGQQVEEPLVQVTLEGEVRRFPCEIMNPTGVAFGADGQLYVSSRNDGRVLRYR